MLPASPPDDSPDAGDDDDDDADTAPEGDGDDDDDEPEAVEDEEEVEERDGAAEERIGCVSKSMQRFTRVEQPTSGHCTLHFGDVLSGRLDFLGWFSSPSVAHWHVAAMKAASKPANKWHAAVKMEPSEKRRQSSSWWNSAFARAADARRVESPDRREWRRV